MLRGDNVKEDTRCQAVFAERRSTASQMTAATAQDAFSRPSTWKGWRSERRSLSLQTSEIEGRLQIAKASADGMPNSLDEAPLFSWSYSHSFSWSYSHWDSTDGPSGSFGNQLYGNPLAGLLSNENWKNYRFKKKKITWE